MRLDRLVLALQSCTGNSISPVEFDKLSSINQDLLRLSSYARNVGFAAFSIEKLET